jgi:virginiamycin B lyase
LLLGRIYQPPTTVGRRIPTRGLAACWLLASALGLGLLAPIPETLIGSDTTRALIAEHLVFALGTLVLLWIIGRTFRRASSTLSAICHQVGGRDDKCTRWPQTSPLDPAMIGRSDRDPCLCHPRSGAIAQRGVGMGLGSMRVLLICLAAVLASCSDGTAGSRSPSPVSTSGAEGVGLAPHIYWTEAPTDASSEPGTIAAAVGADVRQGFVTGTTGGGGVAVDSRHIYWANQGTGTIGRADLDGSHVDQGFVTGASDPVGVADGHGYIYWTNLEFSRKHNDFEYTIGRAKLDGSDVNQRFVVATHGGAHFLAGLAVDGRFIYWADPTFDQIGRAAIDGTRVDEQFVSGANSPTGVAVSAAFLYWSNGGNDSIGRALLDGTDVSQRCVVPTAVPVGNETEGVATDGQYVYWSNYPGNAIGRANLDGTSAVSGLIAAAGVPEGVAVYPQRSMAASTGASCAQSPEPVVLGIKPSSLKPGSLGPYATGWGQVAPALLSNGGASPNGTISNISWSSWGGPVAEGKGLNPIYMPNGGYYDKPAVIQLRVADIRRCTPGGPLSYTTLMIREQIVPGGAFGLWRTDAADLCKSEGI